MFRPIERGPIILSMRASPKPAYLITSGSLLILAGHLVFANSSVVDPAQVALDHYQSTISPILEKHCYECHGDGYDKGQVAFDTLETDAQKLDPSLWLRVLVNTRAGLMPAEQKPRLSAAEQAQLERWIKYDVFRIDPRNPDPGRVTVRRLNRVEYENTVKDLLGVHFNAEQEFPPDDTGYGFDNIGDVLTISPMLMEKYVAAAQAVVADGVPLAPRKPAEQTVWGMTFQGPTARVKYGGRRMSFYEAGAIESTAKIDQPGTYRVLLDYGVRGDSTFDPGKARMVFKIDGKEITSGEFTYHYEKNFSHESTQHWQPGERKLTVEVQPLSRLEDKKHQVDIYVNKVVIEGPLEKERWIKTQNYERFFPRAIPKSRAERRAYAREVLTEFASQAYRRPAPEGTGDRLAALAESVYTQKGKTFEHGMQQAVAAVLASPRFLFRLEEPVDAAGKYAAVDEYSLASRLSYFLWSTMPDRELLDLAARGELRRNLRAQVARMLADERAANFAKNFTGQWLETRDVEGASSNANAIIARDRGEEGTMRALREAFRSQNDAEIKRLFAVLRPIFDSKLELDTETRKAMREETELYFTHVVKEDLPVTQFIDSDWTFVNDKLAKLYGLPDVSGTEMRKITLPKDSPRGGVLTQASTLVVTSNPDRTSPVKRGLFVLANFLGTPPPPPPANVPALEASDNHIDGREPTLRESLAIHRENPACFSCHNRMDPIGLAFENFNALGAWRDTERKQPIQSLGQLVTGEKFNSVSELKRILATGHRDEFYRTLTEKMLTYATGRGTAYYDVETVDGIVQKLQQNDGRFSALLMGVVESAPFQKMRTQATVTAAN